MAPKSMDKMSLEELKALKKEVEAAIDSFQERKRAEALKAMEAVAKEHGLSIEEVLGVGKKRKKTKVVQKYRNPKNSAQTWSGRGRQPGWFKDAVTNGASVKSLEIQSK